jgi:hypothetical protein
MTCTPTPLRQVNAEVRGWRPDAEPEQVRAVERLGRDLGVRLDRGRVREAGVPDVGLGQLVHLVVEVRQQRPVVRRGIVVDRLHVGGVDLPDQVGPRGHHDAGQRAAGLGGAGSPDGHQQGRMHL